MATDDTSVGAYGLGYLEGYRAGHAAGLETGRTMLRALADELGELSQRYSADARDGAHEAGLAADELASVAYQLRTIGDMLTGTTPTDGERHP